MTITMRPMSECQPVKGTKALLYVEGVGYEVGLYDDGVDAARMFRLANAKPYWSIPDYQCGCETLNADDPRIWGWHPLPDEELTGPV